MKRLLVVADDRALTRFVAEAMLGRSLSAGGPRPHDPWEISRAHSGLEAFLLVTRGSAPFDVILLDYNLPDQDVLELFAKLRKTEEALEIPVFLLTERGRDQHSRRLASEKYNVAGFIEKPVTTDSLRTALDSLERKRRVLLVEQEEEIADRYFEVLGHAGFLVEVVRSGREALDRAPRYRPDVVICSLGLDDMSGVDVCVELKKTGSMLPVVLYGQLSKLGGQEIAENAHRADDFIQAPFDDDILVERVGALIGRGVPVKRKRPRGASGILVAPISAENTLLNADGSQNNRLKRTVEVNDEEEDKPPAAPPPSASPAPVGKTQRSTRRVPCNLSMSVRNGEEVYTSKTLDISHGGIFLASDQPIPIGTLIDMTFQIPNTDRVVSAVGKVAWIGKGGTGNSASGVGVKFSKIDPKDLQLIVDYVNRVSRLVYSAT